MTIRGALIALKVPIASNVREQTLQGVALASFVSRAVWASLSLQCAFVGGRLVLVQASLGTCDRPNVQAFRCAA